MAKNIQELCVDIADAIRTKEGSSELIIPQDFPQRINDLPVGGGESGGGELEGDYFLAKANEYYWKPNLPMVEKLTVGMPEYRAYSSLCTLFTQMGAAFEGVHLNGLRVGYKDVNFLLQTHFKACQSDSAMYSPVIAVRESDIDNPIFGKYRNLVELYKTNMETQGTPMTDEEVVALIEEMGVTRITKEEFEALITR